jgi:hypothetical protein
MKSKAYGITQEIWEGMSQERRLAWGLCTLGLTGIAGLIFVTKSGYPWIDVPLAFLIGALSLLIVQLQRNLGKFAPKSQRMISRVSVVGTLYSVIALGVITFCAVIYSLYRGVIDAYFSSLPIGSVPVRDLLTVITFSIALFIALIKAPLNTFRGMPIERLIKDAPKKALIKYLVRRRFVARDLPSFIFVEVVILNCTWAYSSLTVAAMKIALNTLGHI